jgi:hypothetical protein
MRTSTFFNSQKVTPNGDTRSYTGIVTHRLAIAEGLLQSTFSLSNINTTISPQCSLGMTVLPYLQSVKAVSGRLPTYFSTDGRVAKDIKVNSKYTLRLSISINNITSHFNALEVQFQHFGPSIWPVLWELQPAHACRFRRDFLSRSPLLK